MTTTQHHGQRQPITALAAPSASTAIVAFGMTRDQLELIKRTIAKGTTDDEFALFMTTANRLGLDPFAKQIYAVKRWDSKEKREVMAIQVGIDGFRAVAARSGNDDGQDGPFWCGADGVWRDVWLGDGPPVAAKLLVYKKGCARPFVGIARYRSYAQTNRDGDVSPMWRRGDDFMLAKCAEALALRKAHPAELSGVHAPEELDHEAEEAAVTMQPLPAVAIVSAPPSAAKPAAPIAEPARQPEPVVVVAAPPAAAKQAAPTPAPMTDAEANELEKLIVTQRTESGLKELFRNKIAQREMPPAMRERLIRVFGDQKQLIVEAMKAEAALAGAEPRP